MGIRYISRRLIRAYALKTKFGCQKPSKESEIIVYCREGRRAQDAVMSLLELGYRLKVHMNLLTNLINVRSSESLLGGQRLQIYQYF